MAMANCAICGDGRVIHLSSENCDLGQTGSSEVKVREDDFWKATGDNPAVINNDKDFTLKPFPPIETVRRAKSSLDEEGYNWMLFNCEHFASWCRYGRRQSDQVDEAAVAGASVFGPSGGKGILQVYGLIKALADPN